MAIVGGSGCVAGLHASASLAVWIRLATYNVLHGMTVLGGVAEPVRDASGKVVGPPPVADDVALRDAVAQLDADVLGLQEVDVRQPRSGLAHQVRSVAEAMDGAALALRGLRRRHAG